MAAILLVVGDAGTRTHADNYLSSALQSLGHAVTYRSDDDADSVSGFDGVVIAESVASATIAGKYVTAALPLISHEPQMIDDLLLTTNNGTSSGVMTQLTITDDTHPIFDGPFGSYTGTVTFTASGSQHTSNSDVADPKGAGVTYLAALTGSPTQRLAIACESGAALVTGNAPGKRAFLFPNATIGAGLLTADGNNILKNAYAWAFGVPGVVPAAFPTTPILDTFTGSDETPIATNWSVPSVTGDNEARRLSNQFAPAVAGAWSGAYYDVGTFGPDCECYVTVATLGVSTVWVRGQTPGTSGADGYIVHYEHGGTPRLLINRLTNAVSTQLVNVPIATLSAGDGIGIRAVGSNIESWVRRSGVWERVSIVTDTTFPNAGYLAAEVNGTVARLDDFGGGTVTVTDTIPPISIPTTPVHTW